MKYIKQSINVILFLAISCVEKAPENNGNTLNVSKDTIPMSDLKFLKRKVAFKTTSDDTLLVAKYPFVNIGNKLLVIEDINPDCTCTGYFLSKKNIPPGDSAYILLKYSTKDRFGDAKVYATVIANTPTRMYSIEIEAIIQAE